MKKTIMTLALVATIGFVGFNFAEARWGGGGSGPGNCGGPRWSQNAQVDNPEYEEFFNETADLRKQLFEKRGEYAEVLNQENPDKELASQIWSEMFDLKTQLHAKAKAAGIERGFGHHGKGGGRFMGGSGCGNGPCGSTPCAGNGPCAGVPCESPGACLTPDPTN